MIIIPLLQSCAENKNSQPREIAILDSLIQEHKHLERAKLDRIADLYEKRNRAVTPSEKYSANALLFDEYSTFQSDSAMHYVNQNLLLASQNNDTNREIKSKIEKSELLTATGLLSESAQIMRSIDRKSLPRDLQTDYYGGMIFLLSHLGDYTGGDINDFYLRERAYRDSIISIIPTSHPEYLWYSALNVLGTPANSDSIIKALEEKLKNADFNSRQDAKDAYILAKLFEEKNDNKNYLKYMALSATADVRTSNAEIASIEDLARYMFKVNDIDRAYSYINYSLNKAITFPNRVKAYAISLAFDKIYNAYQEKNRRQQEATLTYLILACILAVMLIGLIIFIIRQNAKLRRQGKALDFSNKELNEKVSALSEAEQQLNIANSELTKLNHDLQQKNEELNEANYVKEEYIGYVFTICSNYISKLEDLKRNIHVKALAKKYKEIESETANLDMKGELKEFYHSFDTIFLHIYPNFVNDFNTLLQDDKKIYPKDGELLNTELRIYALVRLGISDSVKISDFLHCSPQTVYNNRFKVRNKAKISKKEFAESVRNLGKFMDRTS